MIGLLSGSRSGKVVVVVGASVTALNGYGEPPGHVAAELIHSTVPGSAKPGRKDSLMPRVTQVQAIEADNEVTALAFFESALAGMSDPRRPQGTRYPLRTVVVTALMAMVCGSDDAEALESFGEANEEWLSTFLEMPHGPATQDVFLAVFGALDPEKFSEVFRGWADLLSLRLAKSEEKRHLAVDGKTSRRSSDRASGRAAIHTVSAWLSGAGLVLGQRKTGEKSNEITAIPELLRVLDLKNTTVTIDAMGCQVEIAKTIVDGGGDYLLAVKDNQGALNADIAATFKEARDDRVRPFDERPGPVMETFTEVDKGHGRVETRTVTLCRDLAWMETAERWPGLSFVVEVHRERTVLSKGLTQTETAHYIGSDEHVGAKAVLDLTRQHWSIENGLHWVLDTAFREDEARHRAKNCAQNMTTLRHFALNVLKQDKTRKLGIANSRKRAGWDRAYLVALLTMASA